MGPDGEVEEVSSAIKTTQFSIAQFSAKFKQLTVRSRDQFARLDFEAEPEQMAQVAAVLVATDKAVGLYLNEIFMDAKFDRLVVDGGGKSWVRFVVSLEPAAAVVGLVNRVVEVRVE